MRASIFITCLCDVLYPDVGVSAVHVLRRLGVEVDFPERQTCCGQPAYNSGFNAEAAAAAASLLDAFQESEVVVVPSGSCLSMLQHYVPKLSAGTGRAGEAQALAAKSYEFSQFLVDALGVEDVGAAMPCRATYHTSCHMARGLGVEAQPLRLLRNVKGLELVDLPYAADCCGFGGTFAVKMAKTSEAMGAEKVDHVAETETDILVGSDMACLMHLGGLMNRRGTETRVMHVAQVLDEGGAA